jgi:GGDEF domain-containing protein
MLWYIAFIALLNLGLGYLWGAYIRRCPRCAKARAMGLSLLTPTSPIELEHGSEPLKPVAVPPTEAVAAPAAEGPPAEIVDAVEFPAPDPETGLVTREHAEKLLTDLAATDGGPHITVALVELAPIDWVGQSPDVEIDKRVASGVTNIVRQSLAAAHTIAQFSEQQLLVLAPDEDLTQVTRRAEELRQRVATTEFVADGRSFQTTVTCALVAASIDQMGPRLFGFLQEALDEAKRYGGNRTFMHDGKSPTPVVPAEIPVTPQQLAI